MRREVGSPQLVEFIDEAGLGLSLVLPAGRAGGSQIKCASGFSLLPTLEQSAFQALQESLPAPSILARKKEHIPL